MRVTRCVVILSAKPRLSLWRIEQIGSLYDACAGSTRSGKKGPPTPVERSGNVRIVGKPEVGTWTKSRHLIKLEP